MATQRPIQKGDFVVIDGNRDDLHAIRSVDPNGVIVIYPLNNQTNVKRLFQRNGQWIIGGENQGHTLQFIEYVPWIPPKGYLFGIERFINIRNTPNLNKFIDYVGDKDVYIAPIENIEEIYDDLSAYEITKEQYLDLLRLRINGTDQGHYNKAQVEWLLKAELFPQTYDFGWMIQHEDLDIIKRVDRVSQALRVNYSEIIELLWASTAEESDESIQFVLNLSRYLSDKGIYPDEDDLEFAFRREGSIPLIKVLIEKNAILNPQGAIDLARESGDQEMEDLLVSAYQPAKSARKR